MYDKVLLPTDGSEYSEEEISRVKKVLNPNGEILILSVANKLVPYVFQKKEHIDDINKTFYEEAQKNVEHMKQQFDSDCNITTKVVVGFAAEKIVEVAEEDDVDLIIISGSGRSGVQKFLLGSVAERVVVTASTDVLLVRN
mgnify:FL=1